MLGLQQQAQFDKDTLNRHIENYKLRIKDQDRRVNELQALLHEEKLERKRIEAEADKDMQSAQMSPIHSF